jgi:hypothetical protein
MGKVAMIKEVKARIRARLAYCLSSIKTVPKRVICEVRIMRQERKVKLKFERVHCY